jgi:hypothetical protein
VCAQDPSAAVLGLRIAQLVLFSGVVVVVNASRLSAAPPYDSGSVWNPRPRRSRPDSRSPRQHSQR